MAISVLGICGSPVKQGNTEAFLREALTAAAADGATTELVTLAGKTIKDCDDCDYCLRHQEKGRFCNQNDAMQALYPRVLEADGIIIASPAHDGRISAALAVCLDRLRCLTQGNYYCGALKNKVGGAMAVSALRNDGLESTLQVLVGTFLGQGMIPATPKHGLGSQLGATGLSTLGGSGQYDPADRDNRLHVLKDAYGMESARSLGKELVKMVRVTRAGFQALGEHK